MNWFYFWLGLYLILIVALTLRHVKHNRLESYLVNDRKTGTLLLVFTTLATFVGGGTSIGLMAMGYESGFAAVGIGIAYVIGFMILIRFAGKIRTYGALHNIYTFPHYLNNRFSSLKSDRFNQLFSTTVSGVNIFIFFFLLAAQFVGMASLLKFTFEIGYQSAAIISCIIVISYTALAGLSGVIITDMIQFLAIVLMILLIFIPGILIDTDNLKRLTELPSNMLNGSYYGWVFLIALPLFLAPSVIVRMDIWQRLLAAKSEKTAKRMSLFSGLGMLPFYIIFPLVGMAIRLTTGDDIEPKDVTYIFIDQHTGSFLLGFAVVGLLSALMSSGDSFLNIISISFVNDFIRKPHKQEKDKKFKIRLATIAFGITALIIALLFPKIVDLMVVGIGTIVIFVPVTFLALTHKNIVHYNKIALWSILSGFIINITFFIGGLIFTEILEPKSSFIPAFICAALVLIIGVQIKKKKR